jgi:DNA polymerase-3 subunit epsilon
MGHTFTAIDFETAQGYRWSICQVGLVRVESGIITHEIDLLVQPPDNYYWQRFTEIHGISARDTINAPTFDQIWHKIAPFIENQNVIAHNGFGLISRF